MDYAKSKLNQVRRIPERGQYDRELIHALVDEALIGHIAFVQDGQPFVIPTLIARDGDDLIVHGSAASRMMEHLASGAPVSVAVTHIDALVLARSVFHHSVNYRSAVLFGTGEKVTDETEAIHAMAVLTNRLIPQRWEDARLPNAKEMKATMIVRIKIHAASAKTRAGGPKDDAEDYDLPYWAGILPVQTTFGEPVPDENRKADVPIPDYLAPFRRV